MIKGNPYQIWTKEIEMEAWSTIGKTTFKERHLEKFSEEVENKRKQKAPLKDRMK